MADGTLRPGKIKCHDTTPRSYLIKNDFGNVIRRNRTDIHKSETREDPLLDLEPDVPPSENTLPELEPDIPPIRAETTRLPTNDHSTTADVPVIPTPVSTRSGRLIVKPARYRDD